MELNKIYFDPSKDETIAAELGGKSPGEPVKITINGMIESNEENMIALNISSIEPSISLPEEESLPAPTPGSAVERALSATT